MNNKNKINYRNETKVFKVQVNLIGKIVVNARQQKSLW